WRGGRTQRALTKDDRRRTTDGGQRVDVCRWDVGCFVVPGGQAGRGRKRGHTNDLVPGARLRACRVRMCDEIR
ncbi:MAG: hypothetical protein JXA14_13265, partial [Anaerolineae bacterium]|nr:hypothetical protein [Anaerolineae bacterium]